MGDILPIILFAGLIILGIYLLFLLASIANEKGSSWTGYFILSLFCWPIAFIWAVWILEDKSDEEVWIIEVITNEEEEA